MIPSTREGALMARHRHGHRLNRICRDSGDDDRAALHGRAGRQGKHFLSRFWFSSDILGQPVWSGLTSITITVTTAIGIAEFTVTEETATAPPIAASASISARTRFSSEAPISIPRSAAAGI
jgi:hypothetical protein